MPDLTNDEVITNKNFRTYIQWGGPRPGNVQAYYGQDAQYMVVEGLSVADANGSIDPIWVADPRRAGKYKLVGRSFSPPDLSEATIIFREEHGAIPRPMQQIGCAFNVYMPGGTCKDLSDPLRGWSDYVMVLDGATVSGNKDGGARSAFTDDNPLEDSVPVKLNDVYPIGALSFADNAQSFVTLEVIEAVFGGNEQCGECGPANDGSKWIYAVTKSSGSTPGTAPRMIYSVDSGVTWTQSTIDTIGDTEDAITIDVVGPYLVVCTRTAGGTTTGGYYYSTINPNTGAPGTWVKVTSGFVAAFQPYDVYVLSPREVFFCADGGYIYKSTDITTGVSVASPGNATTMALRRISGDKDNTIVAVGGSGVVAVSLNRGRSWFTASSSPAVVTLQAVAVVSDIIWWVGSNLGRMYYTLNGGASWTEKSFSGSGAGQVYDIVALNQATLFLSHSTATPTARIFSTWDGGENWVNDAPRILNFPTANRVNRIAFPNSHISLAANNIVAAGLAGNGSDGVLLLGVAARL